MRNGFNHCHLKDFDFLCDRDRLKKWQHCLRQKNFVRIKNLMLYSLIIIVRKLVVLLNLWLVLVYYYHKVCPVTLAIVDLWRLGLISRLSSFPMNIGNR